MNFFALKLVVAGALVIAPLAAFAASPESSSALPAPISLMNLAPSFADHPGDLTLLASLGTHALPTPRVLTLKQPENSTPRLSNTITRASATNFRFDAKVPDSPVGLITPQAGRLTFRSDSLWLFRKSN